MRSNDKNGKPCELVSWSHFQTLARVLAEKIRKADFQPDMMIAIGRGGYMPARLLSDFFGIMDLADIKIEHYRGTHKQSSAVIKYPLRANMSAKKVLLVDDVSDSGDTFNTAIHHILQMGKPLQLRTAVLHHKITSAFTPDFYAAKIVKWRWLIYPWAVTEDISSLIEAEIPLPASHEQIKQHLLQHHGITVTEQQLQDALLLVGRGK